MTTTMHTTAEPAELFKQLAGEAGLDQDKMPAAVQMALQALGAGAAPFIGLIGDLPASARAWDYMGCAFQAYADWCKGTIAVDD